jgi:DNA-binding NarL/FixJ family response regulator
MNHAAIRQRRSVPVEVRTEGRLIDLSVTGELPLEGAGVCVGIIEDQRVLHNDVKSFFVVLLDVGLSGISKIEAFRKLQESFPDLLLLDLTEETGHKPLLEEPGAVDCKCGLEKRPFLPIPAPIHKLMDGGASLPPDAQQSAMRLFRDFRRLVHMDYGLTPHETRLLQLLAEGHSYKTAAAELGVTPHTIDFHLRNVYGKLQVHSKSEAVSKALRHHLVH